MRSCSTFKCVGSTPKTFLPLLLYICTRTEQRNVLKIDKGCFNLEPKEKKKYILLCNIVFRYYTYLCIIVIIVINICFHGF